jgi:hypothetical protein
MSFGGFFTYFVPVRLSAYDSADALVDSTMSLFATNLALSGDPASAPNELIQISFGGGISRVLIEGDLFGASFTLDDATYEHIAVSEVPEPATFWLLLSAGVLVLGPGSRRLRRRA